MAESKKIVDEEDLRIHSIFIVAAPKCSACGEVMVPASDIDWKCQNEACGFKGEAVYTGVIPIQYF